VLLGEAADLTAICCDPINKNRGSSSIIGFNMSVQFDLWKTLSSALLASVITYAYTSHMTCQYHCDTVRLIEEEASHLSYKLGVRVLYRDLVSVEQNGVHCFEREGLLKRQRMGKR
jgi:hypothetical protein